MYCGPECWPSRPRTDPDLVARHAELATKIERGEASVIESLVFRRLDSMLAQAKNAEQNGLAQDSVIGQLTKRRKGDR